ncbi:MAG: OmpH family outer membrane protein [Dysgonamonadaceae bacterium]|jgi:hypothetical protein|nr:OmpH family outer membrane protein [Dysgonamonadaceae bacterium]
MTKITTGNKGWATLISWVVALAVFVGAWLLFVSHPPSEQDATALLERKKEPAKRTNEKIKREQSQRPLPADYAEQLVKQSEILVAKELDSRLKKFQEMAKKMRQRKDDLLTQVETRRLPSTAPANANNTSQARNIPQVDNIQFGKNASVQDLYERLRAYETEIQNNNLAVNAAKLSLSKGLSFPEVYQSLKAGSSFMPDFNELISRQTNGGDWDRHSGSNASAGLYIGNTADLNNYRGLLGQASHQAGLANSRLEGLFGIPQPGGNLYKGNGNDGQGSGNGNGDGGMASNYGNNQGYKTAMSYYQGHQLNEDMVKAQALPGRRFSKKATRKGWMYVNTWYMIGPWESYGRDDFSIIHPPEIAVDFDAVYTDGQVGSGIVETDSHPIMVMGEEVGLNGTLRWKFMQSESMHNTVPVLTNRSTYYAYTELFFDEPTTMRVAIGTDDSGKVWINGKEVWQDNGSSWYHIDEHIAPFNFRQGWNRILVRLENGGGGAAGFSFLIIPKS